MTSVDNFHYACGLTRIDDLAPEPAHQKKGHVLGNTELTGAHARNPCRVKACPIGWQDLTCGARPQMTSEYKKGSPVLTCITVTNTKIGWAMRLE